MTPMEIPFTITETMEMAMILCVELVWQHYVVA